MDTQLKHYEDSVDRVLAEAYQWALVPTQKSPQDPVLSWDEIRVAGTDSVAVRISRRLKDEAALIANYGGVTLRHELDRIPLWRGDHVAVKQLWNDFTQYLYLPRLRDSSVLVKAIEDGLTLTTWDPDTFAYASGVDPDGRYQGLVHSSGAHVLADGEAVVVKPEAAQRQLGREHPPTPPDTDTETEIEPKPLLPPTARLRRFYGKRGLETVRMVREVSDIADAIVAQLGRAPDATVRITLEIEAESAEGFSEELRRTVTENSRTLKFDAHEFEE